MFSAACGRNLQPTSTLICSVDIFQGPESIRRHLTYFPRMTSTLKKRGCGRVAVRRCLYRMDPRLRWHNSLHTLSWAGRAHAQSTLDLLPPEEWLQLYACQTFILLNSYVDNVQKGVLLLRLTNGDRKMGYKRKQGDKKRSKANNLVAKHAHSAGAVARTHADRKLRAKQGYVKHKGVW